MLVSCWLLVYVGVGMLIVLVVGCYCCLLLLLLLRGGLPSSIREESKRWSAVPAARLLFFRAPTRLKLAQRLAKKVHTKNSNETETTDPPHQGEKGWTR